MKHMFQSLIMLLVVSLAVFAGSKDKKNKSKIHGYMFGDFYFVAANHDSALQDQNGFWLRRIYLGYDKKLDGNFSMRLRLEMASPGNFTSSSKLTPAVKDAYLKWKKGANALIIGISGTPTWGLVEKIWGYRSVEKTPLDLQKYGSSRDLGIALKGKLPNGKVGYHLMLGNGNSNKSETNKGKKLMGAINFNPTKALVLEVYGDWNDNPGQNDVITLQGFAGLKTEKATVGLLYARQTRKVENSEDVNLKIGSAFVVAKVNQKLNLFARVDRLFDPNPGGNKISYIPFDKTAKAVFFVGGLDISPAKKIHFIPNVEAVKYDKNDAGITPETDLIGRVTTYFKF